MEQKIHISLDLSPETINKINETGFPLEDKIRQLQDVEDIQREYLHIQDEPATKSLAVTIIVSAAAAYLVMRGIAQIIREINGGGKTMIYDDLVPLLNKDGNPVMENDGKTPVFYKRKSSISVDQAFETQTFDMDVLKSAFRLREGFKESVTKAEEQKEDQKTQ